MDKRIDILIPLKNGFRAVLSSPMFIAFGVALAVPKGLAQLFDLDSAGLGNATTQFQSGGVFSFSWMEMAILLLFAGVMLFFGSLGIAGLVSLMNRRENGESISLFALWKSIRYQVKNLVILETLLIMFALVVGSILSIPASVALSRGLTELSHALSYSAFGLLLSISILLFFLRQYAALYLSLSKLSVRAALENALNIFRRHMRETFLLSISLFLGEVIAILFISEGFSLARNLFEQNSPRLFLLFGTIAEWICLLGALSFIEAWKWTSWTSFFRMIALPKDSDSILQKSETVLQQESIVNLDEA